MLGHRAGAISARAARAPITVRYSTSQTVIIAKAAMVCVIMIIKGRCALGYRLSASKVPPPPELR